MAVSGISSNRWTFDVFLSFRGVDTRKNFTDHLYLGLKDAGINVFRDDNELRRGEDITTELLTAIEGSRISIIVFSRNYADSRWCLEELVKIMECRKKKRQWVLPVFYDVDPADLRKHTASFADAFSKHEKRFALDMEKIDKWKAALTDAANLSGWDLRNTAAGHEAKTIKKIIEQILSELNHTYLSIAVHPVGIDSRVRKMISLLSIGSNDVRMVGICGMGGLGKTTIAKAVFNHLFHNFDGKCFLANVGEISRQCDGLVHLQEQLLSDVLKAKKLKIGSVDRGINIIRERLCNRRILVVIDNVDNLDQLNTVARMHDWFGLGSRIIITTRDEHLLKEIGVDKIYMLKEMDDDESLQLFSWHAFRKNHPIENYVKLSKEVVDYSKGVPLALEVLGCFLFDRTLAEWKSALEKLKRIPHDQIHRKLRVSLDTLDHEERQIFLDIACFLMGMKKDIAIKILDACDFFAEIGISVLTRRCLLTVNEKNELRMHDLLRDMGREIVREESPNNPGKRSRLWNYEDGINVLTENTGTETVEGFFLRLPRVDQAVHSWNTEAFVMMKRLRLLQLDGVNLVGSCIALPKDLRWLCWNKFHLKFIPNDFNMKNLVILDLQYSNLHQVWRDNRMLLNIKILNLSHSPYLTKTPDLLKLPSLERLILKDCPSLVEIHQSTGQHRRIITLNFKGCTNLKTIPRGICKLKSLEQLNICGCLKINSLPEDLGEMESLEALLADGTAIRQVPYSIVRLNNLRKLSLGGCKGTSSSWLPSRFLSWVSARANPICGRLLPESLLGLSSLTILLLRNCNLSDDLIPKDIGYLSLLQELDLSGNIFHTLPASISKLSKLQYLVLDGCKNLQSLPEDIGQLCSLETLDLRENGLCYLPGSINALTSLFSLDISGSTNLLEIPELPTSLENLFAADCTSLERMSNLSRISGISSLTLRNCHKLIEIPGLRKMEYIGKIHMEGCNSLQITFKNSLLQDWFGSRCHGIVVPGNEIPSWFNYQNVGPSIWFQMPQFQGFKIKGFTICFISASIVENKVFSFADSRMTLSNKTKGLKWHKNAEIAKCYLSAGEQMSMSYFSHEENFDYQIDGGNQLELTVETFDDRLTVKKCGVHVAFEQEETCTALDDEQSTQYSSCILHSSKSQAGINPNQSSVLEEGPSHGWSIEDQEPKRLRYE